MALARRLNDAVDGALQNADEGALTALLEAGAGEETMALCSRIWRRAILQARRDPAQAPAVIAARDRRVLEVQGHRVPKGWFTAWCDGSSADGAKRSGIGVVLMNAERRLVEEFGEFSGHLSPLQAELMALEAAVRTAVARGARRLRVRTDCPALIHLWENARDDERLSALRQAVGPLERLQLYLAPRRFNRLAHSLARRAAAGTRGGA